MYPQYWTSGIGGTYQFQLVFVTIQSLASLRRVAHYDLGISIEFQAAYRHPFVGAVIDRPRKRAEFRRKFT